LLALAAAPPAAAKRKLPPYREALRCASLTEAWAMQVEIMSLEGSKRMDPALYWGLVSADAARFRALPPVRYKRDQIEAVEAARAQLQSGNEAAAAELDRCLAAVPPRKPRRH
jgi:hypothetical protein